MHIMVFDFMCSQRILRFLNAARQWIFCLKKLETPEWKQPSPIGARLMEEKQKHRTVIDSVLEEKKRAINLTVSQGCCCKLC